MKNYLILTLLCGISIILIPLAMTKGNNNFKNTDNASVSIEEQASESAEQDEVEKNDTIAVFRSVSNTVSEISLHEYVCGSVAAEMPLAYEEEAIKAQAVACYTNALRMIKQGKDKNNSNISDDTTIHQGYVDKTERKAKWGEDFEKYESKLQSAVNEVENLAIYYNDNLCIAAFCAVSNGKTEDAENLWGSSVPYLKSVKSDGDKLSPGYATTVSFDKKDFLKALKDSNINYDNITSLKNTLKVTEKSSAGTVLSCNLNGKTYTGEDIRKIFSLRSPTFTVKSTDSSVTFSVTGYGHGIGLSQYGSNYLAQQGYSYEEILKHYYTDVEIK